MSINNKKKIVSIIFSTLFTLAASAQTGKLPVKEWNSTDQTPLVLYISGDGGYDGFSIKMCNIINKAGYSITAVSARAYFWDQKTPEQTATDITTYLENKFRNRQNQQLVLAGYSFGSDILPFVVNKLGDSIKNKLISVVLLSPSTFTDFGVHWSHKTAADKVIMDVAAEMNKMSLVRTATIFGRDENIFPVKDIKLKNYSNEILPGGHHFDGNTAEVAKTMMKYFK